MECKYCKSQNLILEQRSHETDDILNANQVAVKCADCGRFIKWCAKDERKAYYINTMKQGAIKLPETEVVSEPKSKTPTKSIDKADVIAIIDKVLQNSARLFAYPTIRSAEVRAMLNGVKDEIKRL